MTSIGQALASMRRAKKQWIEGVVEVVSVVAGVRDRYPADQDFNDWFTVHNLADLKNDLPALIEMGRLDPALLRSLLERTNPGPIALVWKEIKPVGSKHLN